MDIGSLLYFGAIAVWSGTLAYFLMDKLVPKREEASASVKAEEPAFPTHRTSAPAPEEFPKQPSPDYQMTEGFKSFQTGTELTVDDIVKGLSRRG